MPKPAWVPSSSGDTWGTQTKSAARRVPRQHQVARVVGPTRERAKGEGNERWRYDPCRARVGQTAGFTLACPFRKLPNTHLDSQQSSLNVMPSSESKGIAGRQIGRRSHACPCHMSSFVAIPRTEAKIIISRTISTFPTRHHRLRAFGKRNGVPAVSVLPFLPQGQCRKYVAESR